MKIPLINIAIIFIISLLVLVLLKRDFRTGISVTIFLLIVLPRELYYEFPGILPTLNCYRGIMVALIYHSLFISKKSKKWEKIAIISSFKLLLIAKLITLTIAYNFTGALNGFIVVFLEIFLFFIILIREIDDKETIIAIIYSISFAIFIIAIIGFVEKYTQFNPVDYISSGDNPRFDHRNRGAVYSTLSHPIHFGTVLAMGWPICLLMEDRETNRLKKKLYFLTNLILIASLYFSMSRGPWLGFLGANIMLILYRFPRIKVKVVGIMILALLVLVSKPGVHNSIFGLASATLDSNSLEGGSFHYRIELFKKAYKEISRSPERFAFGYGDGAAHSMDLRDEVSFGRGRAYSFWSWDSEFAVILLQGGIVGLLTNIILYIVVLFHLTRGYKSVEDKDKRIFASIISSIFVVIFMMTNVAIFSPQLHFLMWTNIAIGVILYKIFRNEQIKSVGQKLL